MTSCKDVSKQKGRVTAARPLFDRNNKTVVSGLDLAEAHSALVSWFQTIL